MYLHGLGMRNRFLKRVELTPDDVDVETALSGHPAEQVGLEFLVQPRLFNVGNEKILRGRLRYDSPSERARFEAALSTSDVSHFYEQVDGQTVATVTHPRAPSLPPEWRWNLALFLLTVVSTLWAGAFLAGESPDFFLREPGKLVAGLPFSASIMGILAAHEFGHYVAARRYGLHVTLPFFIPLPLISPIGTLGAVIRMKTPVYTPRMLLDVGAAGPLAGIVVAIPVAIYGIQTSAALPVGSIDGIQLGEPLLFKWLVAWFASYPEDTHELFLNPVAFAGWIGVFVTALNMLPIGQLDGGHVLYALVSRGQHRIGRVCFFALLIMGWWWSGWYLWAMLVLFIIRIKHPPVLDSDQRLGPGRQIIGWLSVAILVLCFTPIPFKL
jgi:membrane-associated protease RseP (regulator of RpoE activity)